LAACSGCQYVFCNLCKMSYHGIHPCRLRKGKTWYYYSTHI